MSVPGQAVNSCLISSLPHGKNVQKLLLGISLPKGMELYWIFITTVLMNAKTGTPKNIVIKLNVLKSDNISLIFMFLAEII